MKQQYWLHSRPHLPAQRLHDTTRHCAIATKGLYKVLTSLEVLAMLGIKTTCHMCNKTFRQPFVLPSSCNYFQACLVQGELSREDFCLLCHADSSFTTRAFLNTHPSHIWEPAWPLTGMCLDATCFDAHVLRHVVTAAKIILELSPCAGCRTKRPNAVFAAPAPVPTNPLSLFSPSSLLFLLNSQVFCLKESSA